MPVTLQLANQVIKFRHLTLPEIAGKLRRSEALRRWSSGTLHPPARVNAFGLLAAMIRSTLALARARPTAPEPET